MRYISEHTLVTLEITGDPLTRVDVIIDLIRQTIEYFIPSTKVPIVDYGNDIVHSSVISLKILKLRRIFQSYKLRLVGFKKRPLMYQHINVHYNLLNLQYYENHI